MRSSAWLFPLMEILHLAALAVLGGALLLVNLRQLGVRFFCDEPMPELVGEIWPVLLGSLIVASASGMCLFSAEAVKMDSSAAFWVKMGALLTATLFTFTIHRKVLLAPAARFSPATRKTAAALSLLLWFTVGLAGRSLRYAG